MSKDQIEIYRKRVIKEARDTFKLWMRPSYHNVDTVVNHALEEIIYQVMGVENRFGEFRVDLKKKPWDKLTNKVTKVLEPWFNEITISAAMKKRIIKAARTAYEKCLTRTLEDYVLNKAREDAKKFWETELRDALGVKVLAEE